MANTSSHIAPITFPNKVVALAVNVPTAALLLIDLSSPVASVVGDLAAAVVETDTSTPPNSDVAPVNAAKSPLQANHPIATVITPLPPRGPNSLGLFV